MSTSYTRTSKGVHYFVDKKQRRHVTDIHLWIAVRSGAEFGITKEQNYDRLAKAFGMSTEIQTGDLPFDESYYITTDSSDFTAALLNKPEVRAAIAQILEWGFDEVIHDGKRLTAIVRRIDPTFSREQLYLDVADKLVEIGAAMSQTVVTVALPLIPGAMKRNIAYGLSVSLLIASLILGFWASETYPAVESSRVVLHSIPLCVVGFLLYVFLQLLFLVGRSSTHREIILISVISLFTAPLLSYGGYLYVNGAFDTSQSQIREVTIVNKAEHRSGKRHSKKRVIEVTSWLDPAKTIRWPVSWDLYPKIRIGQSHVTLALRSGYLGYQWIESKEIVP